MNFAVGFFLAVAPSFAIMVLILIFLMRRMDKE